jgi:hypothetical protein
MTMTESQPHDGKPTASTSRTHAMDIYKQPNTSPSGPPPPTNADNEPPHTPVQDTSPPYDANTNHANPSMPTTPSLKEAATTNTKPSVMITPPIKEKTDQKTLPSTPSPTTTVPPKTNKTSRADTPPRSNRREPSDTRVELRITIPASSPNVAFKTITDTLAKILVKIWDSDKKATVIPWYNDSSAPLLKNVASIPTTISSLQQYFPRLIPNAKGGTKFTSIRLRLSLPPSTLKEDIDWYLRDNKHGLYLARIQAETVDTILWLLWSHDMMDTMTLRDSIETHLLLKTRKKIPIGLRW